MKQEYPGDTPSKAIARAIFWHKTAPLIDPGKPAVVLASAEGCDVRVLQKLGFAPDAIIAVDRDPRAIEQCKARYPGAARYFVGNVEDVLEQERIQPSVVLLDYCAQPCTQTIRSVMRVGALRPKRLGVVFQAARERPGEWIRVCSVKAYAHSMVDRFFTKYTPMYKTLGFPVDSMRTRKRWAVAQVIKNMREKRLAKGVGEMLGGNNLAYPGSRVVGDWFEWSPWLAIREVDSKFYFPEDDPRLRALIVRAGGVQEALTPYFLLQQGKEMEIEFSVAYRGWKTPMAMTCYDFVEETNLAMHAQYLRLTSHATNGDVRELAEHYMKAGMLPKEAAALTGVDAQTAVAWKAVATRRERSAAAFAGGMATDGGDGTPSRPPA